MSVLVLLSLIAALPAAAQTVRGFEVGTDNDAYDFWVPVEARPDHDYTHGMWAAAELTGAPVWGRLAPGVAPCGEEAPGAPCAETRVEVGQRIFTPYYDAAEPVPGERPYAGWLYAAATARLRAPGLRREVRVEAGVTGPPSLGGSVHRAYHHLLGVWEPRGWEGQLAFEPAASLRWREWRPRSARIGGATLEAGSEWSAALGTLRTSAALGLRARAERGALHAVGAAAGEWVGRDLFLDGNTLRDGGVRVERRPWVGRWSAGVGARWRSLSAEYRVSGATRTYRTQREPHVYATIVLRLGRTR